MANTRTANVIRVDTTAYTYAASVKIESVKYIGASTSSAIITQGTSGSGGKLYENANATTDPVEEINARTDGFYVALTGTAVLYIYLES